MPKPQHILAKKADIATQVVAVGDPARAEQMSKMLKDAKLVNSNRGFLTYTGYYNDRRITISSHGIGGPSSAIVFEELHMLGADTIVRLGTCGAMVKDLSRGDFVVPTAAAFSTGSLGMYVPDGILPPVPDVLLTARLVEQCSDQKVRYKQGIVFSSDAFYSEDPTFVGKWAPRGVIAVEMECATLFTLGILRRFRTAAFLIASDSLVKKTEKEMLKARGIRDRVEVGGEIVLNALTDGNDSTSK